MELHLLCNPDDISRYVLTPGSPERARNIASYFTNSCQVISSRGYLGFSGDYNGVFMTVCSTGIGGPSAAIAFEELAHMGGDTFIRVGSCGVFQAWQKPGDVIVATGTVRTGGTSQVYLPLAFPAIPSLDVTRVLVDVARDLDIPVTVGIGVTGDVFYPPPHNTERSERHQLLMQIGAVFGEMESDTLFILGLYHGWRTGAIFAVDSTAEEKKPGSGKDAFRLGEERTIRIALEAMYRLAKVDG